MHWIFLSIEKKLGGFVLIFLLSFTLIVNGDNLPDTVHIDEIVVSSENISRYQTGAKIEKIEVKQLEMLQDGNLEQLLNRLTPVAFKSMAGGFSTIRFRGTSPDHTSINFGGLNINSLTLGHSNVSNIPMYLFDKVGIQYGSSSAVNGSGSIGGAVHLGLNSYWVNGFKGEIRSAYGSTGEQLYGTKIFVGNGKWESVTRAYYYYNKNEFKYYYSEYKDFETGVKGKNDVLRNASIENKGFIQEFNYKFTQNETFKLMAWVEDDWHLIQQNMATIADTNKKDLKESLQDEHIRIWASYNNRKNPLKFHVGAGYVFDNSIYTDEKGNSSIIRTQRWVSDTYLEHELKPNINYKIGVKAYRINPDVYSYNKSLNFEDRIDMFLQYRQKFYNKIDATLNLRQGFVTDYKVPFTPTVGLSYILTSKEKFLIKIIGNIANNYRVPTFNDRFWGSQGNPNLKPENGMNYELGSKLSYCDDKVSGNVILNTFYMDVDNWILWINKGDWVPENVQHVVSKGIEFQGNSDLSTSWGSINSGFVYAYTSTQRKASESESSAINRQLEYVPLYTCKIYSNVIYKNWNVGFDGQMMPWQYTDQTDGNILDGYFLLNLNAQRKIEFNKIHSLTIRALINNILNVNYQSSYGYAMPRINYKLSITYNFN